MASILTDECIAAGIDPAVVERIAKRIESACKDAEAYGIRLFCGSQNSLRASDGNDRLLILADLHMQNADGGDGGSMEGNDGLRRGE